MKMGTVLLGFSAATALAAFAGARATQRGRGRWYDNAHKAPFQPPDWLFAPVWTSLYTLCAISGFRVWRVPPTKERRRALRLWASQLALNGLWPWIFFRARRPRAALAECAVFLGTAVAYERTARNVDRTAAKLFAPYVAWVAFATLLNEEFVRRNRALEAE